MYNRRLYKLRKQVKYYKNAQIIFSYAQFPTK